jgi:hypothetical protein
VRTYGWCLVATEVGRSRWCEHLLLKGPLASVGEVQGLQTGDTRQQGQARMQAPVSLGQV